MIQDVWGLKHEHKIIGVRVLTSQYKYYDVDIDVYKRRVKPDVTGLKALRLMEYGDLLVTEEEFNSGLLIEDGSEDEELLTHVKAFIDKVNLKDPKYLAKRAKKADEIRKKYYTYVPNRWLREFAEYHIDFFEGNNNIYSTLNDAQFEIVREYFRWRSRLLFEEQKASKVLITKPKKTRQLIEIMGTAEDWVYDGTVDMGYKGGSYCQLGHPLRYEHHAYSPSTTRHIIFGSTCMSDFFQIDETVLKHINQAQEMLLKELKSIVFIIQTDKFANYYKDYENVWDLLKHFKGQFNGKFKNGSGWSKFIGGFTKLGLPLTRSMLMKVKELEKLYIEDMKYKSLENHLEGSKIRLHNHDASVVNGILYDKYELALARNIKLKVVLNDLDSVLVTSGIGLVPSLLKIQSKLHYELGIAQKFVAKAKTLYPFVLENGDRRLATKTEVAKKTVRIESAPYLGIEKTNWLIILMKECSKLVNPPVREFPSSTPQDLIRYESYFKNSLPIIEQAIAWGLSSNFEKEIKPLSGEITLPEGEEDIDVNSIQYKYNFIEANAINLTVWERKAFNAISHIQEKGSRDEPFIVETYNKIKSKLENSGSIITEPNQSGNNSVTLNSSIEDKLKFIEEAKEDGIINESNFVFKIIETVKKYGKVSEKQMKYIDDAILWINNQF